MTKTPTPNQWHRIFNGILLGAAVLYRRCSKTPGCVRSPVYRYFTIRLLTILLAAIRSLEWIPLLVLLIVNDTSNRRCEGPAIRLSTESTGAAPLNSTTRLNSTTQKIKLDWNPGGFNEAFAAQETMKRTPCAQMALIRRLHPSQLNRGATFQAQRTAGPTQVSP